MYFIKKKVEQPLQPDIFCISFKSLYEFFTWFFKHLAHTLKKEEDCVMVAPIKVVSLRHLWSHIRRKMASSVSCIRPLNELLLMRWESRGVPKSDNKGQKSVISLGDMILHCLECLKQTNRERGKILCISIWGCKL